MFKHSNNKTPKIKLYSVSFKTLPEREKSDMWLSNGNNLKIYGSVNSKRQHPPLQAISGVLHLLSARALGFVPSELWGGGFTQESDLLSLVPHCKLVPHEGTFQLQTDLLSTAALGGMTKE